MQVRISSRSQSSYSRVNSYRFSTNSKLANTAMMTAPATVLAIISQVVWLIVPPATPALAGHLLYPLSRAGISSSYPAGRACGQEQLAEKPCFDGQILSRRVPQRRSPGCSPHSRSGTLRVQSISNWPYSGNSRSSFLCRSALPVTQFRPAGGMWRSRRCHVWDRDYGVLSAHPVPDRAEGYSATSRRQARSAGTPCGVSVLFDPVEQWRDLENICPRNISRLLLPEHMSFNLGRTPPFTQGCP